MGEKIKKIKTIAKAMINPLPEGEDWFEKRMEFCNTCDRNTKNMTKEQLSTMDKIKLATSLCPEGDHCTACGCCTHRKAASKNQACGLAEIGLNPKWPALELDSKLDTKITAENLTPEVGELRMDSKQMIYDLGESAEERIDFSISMKRKGGFDIKSTEVSCKCTVADPIKTDEESYRFDIALSTKSFRAGANIERTFTIQYYASSSRIEKAIVTIKLKMK